MKVENRKITERQHQKYMIDKVKGYSKLRKLLYIKHHKTNNAYIQSP